MSGGETTLKNHPPLRLSDFKASVVGMKLAYVAALLRWTSKWLAEVQDMSMDAAFDGLAQAKQIRRLASSVEKTFEEAAMAEMFHNAQSYHVGKDYLAFLRPGTSRKGWKHPQVMEALIEQTCARMQERFPYVPESTLQAIVTESMWQVHKVGRVEWRSTDLRKNGVDPNLYSTRSIEDPSIDLRGEGSYANITRRPRGVRRGE